MARDAGLGDIEGRQGDEDPVERKPARHQFGWEDWQKGGMRVQLQAIPGVTKRGLLRHKYRFQMPPTDTFTRSLSHAHSDFDTIRAGQFSRPVGRQLETVSFSTLVMDRDHPRAVWPRSDSFKRDFEDNEKARRDYFNILDWNYQLENLLESGTPFRLLAGQPEFWQGGGPPSRHGWDVNMAVTLRGMTIEERSAELDTRYLGMEFTEWRSTQVQRKGLTRGAASKTPAVVRVDKDGGVKELGSDYEFATHSTLRRLSTYYYGDPDGWRLIRESNQILRKNNWTGDRDLGELITKIKASGEDLKLSILEYTGSTSATLQNTTSPFSSGAFENHG